MSGTRKRGDGRARRGRRGYTLVALLVGLTVTAILIAAILPLASALAQRDREAELIFRGMQIAEGIRCFRRKYGRYPNSIKEMVDVKPRTLRKAWKDPMTEGGEWGIVSLAGAPVPGQPAPGTGSRTFPPQPTPKPSPTPWPGTASGPAGGGAAPGQLGPVMGVYSLSAESGYRVFQGRENYNEWRFTEQTLMMGGGSSGGYETPGGGAGPGVGGGAGPVWPPPGGGTVPKK